MMKAFCKRPIRWALFFLFVLFIVSTVLAGLKDFDLSFHPEKEITFVQNGWTITGSLHLPEGVPAPPVVILVHGDGPQDRYANGAYLPLINFLLDEGFAVFSLDKPGVGKSTGLWLSQSMEERAHLSLKALNTLREIDDFNNSIIGFIGFSQAGWVLPEIAIQGSAADFFILIGAAIDWMDQGAYFTQKRLEAEGASEEEIARALNDFELDVNRLSDPKLTYQDYMADQSGDTDFSKERFGFVRRNLTANSEEALSLTSAPFLVLHGAQDLNVDAVSDHRRFRDLLGSRNPATDFHLIENATHGLLNTDLFNYQLPSHMPFWSEWAYLALGRDAYADGVLEIMGDWIKARAASQPAAIQK
ncbi:S9 family peptidase [Roseibium sp. TrichSKD4]|uniref:alpha/beta hydrolase family protein n=1 Tax=Roseibium sp. TrichSKD4 TaxID=744980 RepID=UPI00068266D2|nr:alpha/beta fold hydrolase [Roseibium sp. TrichSKD4]